MAEAELHLIRQRLTGGRLHKASKGELRLLVPIGLDYNKDDKIVLAGDEAVRAAIAEVFARFQSLSSARQVLLSLRADGLKLPHRKPGEDKVGGGPRPIEPYTRSSSNRRMRARTCSVASAGDKSVSDTGEVVVRSRLVAREEWEVCIPDHHPGYIDWDTYWRTNGGWLPTLACCAAAPAARRVRAGRCWQG